MLRQRPNLWGGIIGPDGPGEQSTGSRDEQSTMTEGSADEESGTEESSTDEESSIEESSSDEESSEEEISIPIPQIDTSDIAEAPATDFEYLIDEETNNVTVHKYIGTAEKVRIPAEIEGKPVTCVASYPLYWLGNDYKGVFEEAPDTKIVVIPDSVTEIGINAFYKCENITYVEIPSSVTLIDFHAFDGCTSLESILIPNEVTEIGFAAFRDCTSLSAVGFPAGYTDIRDEAFKNCMALTAIKLPNGIMSIGDKTFEGCTGLTSITLPESLKHIPFTPGLTKLFDGCTSLAEIKVAENNAVYGSADGVLYNKKDDIIMCCPLAKTGSLTIPDNIRRFSSSDFKDVTGITSLTLHSNIKEIGGKAFDKCKELKEINYNGETYTSWNEFRQANMDIIV